MALELVGRISAGDEFLDTDLRDLQIVSGSSGVFLYTATGQNGGLSVYQLSGAGGLASLSDSTYFGFSGITIGTFGVMVLDGEPRLMLNGAGHGALVSYAIAGDGDLANPSQTDLPGTGAQTSGAMTSVTLNNGTTALYMSDTTGTLSAWVSDGSGALTGSAPLGGAGTAYDLSGAVSLQVGQVAGASFLLAADASVNGVRAYGINQTTGALEVKGTLGAADGLGVASPTALEVVTAHGTTWVVLAAAGSSSISVMQLGADGGLSPADHLIDTLATRFGGVNALKAVKVGDHVFVLAGGADDGLSLFSLLPGGRLVHLQSLAHETGLGLENITAIEAVEIGGAIQVFVTSGGSGAPAGAMTGGVSQFSIPLGDLGSVIEAGSDGGGVALRGTGRADLIIGAPGQGRLLGEGGDDILVAGSDGGVLTGGKGADIFVLCPTLGSLRITDFRAGTDQIDMSHFPMLRSVGQLTLVQTANGIDISFGTTTITVLSHNGKPLSAAQIWPADFATPDRVPIPEGRIIRITNGSDSDEELIGGDHRDIIYGFDGRDTIRAGKGNDKLEGGGGKDVLYGEGGDDRIIGGEGNDKGIGGKGSDRIYGGDGADWLNGEIGNDRIWGGRDDDELLGEGGNDRLYGNDGNDLADGGVGTDAVYGGKGDDEVRGGADDDKVFGGVGDDKVFGGDGQDVLGGGRGADRLEGGAGNDRIKGGKGNDTVLGEAGADTLRGGAGGDVLGGGAGGDVLLGGTGKDTLTGDRGDDELHGGAGVDTFVFGKRHGADRIVDFTDGTDLIRITVVGVGFDDLGFKRQGSDTLIDTGSGSITVSDTRPRDFTADDFLFS